MAILNPNSKRSRARSKRFQPAGSWRSPLRIANFSMLFAIVGVLFLILSQAAPIAGLYGSVEQDQINRINSTRAANGITGVSHIECLNSVAEQWTQAMAAQGYISHNPNLANMVSYACGNSWNRITENVGVGYESPTLFNAFMGSASHRANILDKAVTKTGVGAYYGSDGRLWVVQVFARCVNCSGNWSTAATLPKDPVAPAAPVVTDRENSGTTAKADFNGDGKVDLASFYDYGSSNTSIFVFTSTGTAFSPASVWNSGSGNWTMNNSRLLAGDFNGDGKADLAGLYDYGSSNMGIWIWPGLGTGRFGGPARYWVSGAGNFSMSNSRFVSGDFNGDGKADLMAAYDYGSSWTKFIYFASSGSGFGTSTVWDGGKNNWTMSRSRFMAGDFNGDGKADVMGLYDYGSDNMGFWQWNGSVSGVSGPFLALSTGNGNFRMSNSKFTVGDFNGDKKADLACFYDYGNASTNIIVFKSSGSGFSSATAWASGQGNYYMSQSRIIGGDFTGDGYADIAAPYDYGSSDMAIFQWNGNSNGLPNFAGAAWRSGRGNWAMPNSIFTN